MLIAALSFRAMDPGERLVPERLEIGRDSARPRSEFESRLARLSLSVPASPSVAPEPAPVAQSAMLPAPGTPLSQSLQALRDAADSGDAFANCRLALELMFCANKGDPSPEMMGMLVPQVSGMSDKRQTGMIDALARSQERAERRAAHCSQLSEVEPGEIEARSRTAAARGGSRQRVLYALMTPQGHIARLMAPPGLTMEGDAAGSVSQFYADNAVQYLHQGLMARDVLALEGLIMAYAPKKLNRPVELPFSLPNPLRFVVLVGLYERLGVGVIPSDVAGLRAEAMAQLPPAMQIQADKLAADEAERWVDGWRETSRKPPALDSASSDVLCRGN